MSLKQLRFTVVWLFIAIWLTISFQETFKITVTPPLVDTASGSLSIRGQSMIGTVFCLKAVMLT
jgi:hypothetical protein